MRCPWISICLIMACSTLRMLRYGNDTYNFVYRGVPKIAPLITVNPSKDSPDALPDVLPVAVS